MYQVRIDLTAGRHAFLPGEVLSGSARWQASGQPVREAEVQLVWMTSGFGDPETGVVASLPFPNPKSDDTRTFQLGIPLAPYSFSGKLITLAWGVRLLINRGAAMHVQEITVGPGRRSVNLHPEIGETDAKDPASRT